MKNLEIGDQLLIIMFSIVIFIGIVWFMVFVYRFVKRQIDIMNRIERLPQRYRCRIGHHDFDTENPDRVTREMYVEVTEYCKCCGATRDLTHVFASVYDNALG